MTRPFSAERLVNLLETAPRGTFFRHDVDFSLFAALQMAEIEFKHGISATYYLFFDGNCPFYTRDQAHSTREKLLELGHDVGLHIDARTGMVGRWFIDWHGKRVYPKVSWHCPTEWYLWRDLDFCQNAYASAWKGRYYADSGGKFRFGDPEDDFRRGRLQINMHAEWWFEPDWLEYVDPDTYEAFFHEKHPLALG